MVRCKQLLHGYPTAFPACIADEVMKMKRNEFELCSCDHQVKAPKHWTRINAARAKHSYTPWAIEFLEEGRTGIELLARECDQCKQKRATRRRVMCDEDLNNDVFRTAPFDNAPALYAYNGHTRYFTLLLRVRQFVQAN